VVEESKHSFVKRLLTEVNGYFSRMQFDHFQFRLVEPKDAEPFFQLIEHNRSRLEDFFSGTVARTRSLQDTIDYFGEIAGRIEARTYFPHLLIDLDHDRFIGFIDIKSIDWNIPKAEIGYFIDAAYEGKGISGKALPLLINFAVKDLGIRKLLIRTHPENRAACRLAEKCGFQQEGIIRSDYKTSKGILVDLVYYGLVIRDQPSF
jgi:RimJ/RimL family protein N-acetyltransferase